MKKTITLLSIVLLSGCSWADGWFDDRPPPPLPRNAALQTAPVVPVGPVAMVNTDASVRIAQLEAEVAALRNDIKMMMPALTKLATSQTDLLYVTEALQKYEPAAGAVHPRDQMSSQDKKVTPQHLGNAVSLQVNNVPEQALLPSSSVSDKPTPPAAARPQIVSSDPRPLTPEPKEIANVTNAGGDQSGVLKPMNSASARDGKNESKRRELMKKKTAQLLKNETMSPEDTSHASRVVNNARQAIVQTSSHQTIKPAGVKSEVRAVRLGEYGDKTRFVVDLENETDFSYDIDNIENLILVDFPKAGWSADLEKNLAASPLVKSYKAVSDGNGGTSLAIQLKAPAQVLWAETLPANGEKSPRVVLDIARI